MIDKSKTLQDSRELINLCFRIQATKKSIKVIKFDMNEMGKQHTHTHTDAHQKCFSAYLCCFNFKHEIYEDLIIVINCQMN